MHIFLRFVKFFQRILIVYLPYEMWVQSLGQEDSLENSMATHSSILAWRIPWTEAPTVHSVAKSWTQLKWLSTHMHHNKMTH